LFAHRNLTKRQKAALNSKYQDEKKFRKLPEICKDLNYIRWKVKNSVLLASFIDFWRNSF